MGRELGRISGPLLGDNLLRNGSDLKFDTDLLLLSVGNSRLGINTLAPTRDLTIANTMDTTDLLVDTLVEVANFVISNNTIQNPLSSITISPLQSNPIIASTTFATSLLSISGNTILNSTANSNIEFSPIGSGVVNIRNNTTVYGTLHSTGDITWDGDITLGNAPTDTINFASDISSNVLPSINNTYDFGSSSLRWNNVYSTNVTSSSLLSTLVTASTAYLGNVTFNTNTIVNSNTSVDISVQASGTGRVKFNNQNFVDGNNFMEPTTGVTFNSTGNGYTKFAGTIGVVLPVGTTGNYPASPLAGAIRYDTDLNYGEVYDGTGWHPIGGTSAVLTQAEVSDAMFAWDLILG